MWYHDGDFWKIVNELGWGRPSTDYHKLGEKLIYFIYDEDSIEQLREISQQKRATIADIIRHTNKNIARIWGGDDSFWDLTAHIVGLGEEFFTRVINNPETINEVGKTYKENFEYLFSKCSDFCKTDEGIKLLKIPLKERKTLYLRTKKLEQILK